MEDILKIAAATVAAAVCAVVVKQRAQEVGLVLSLAAGALVLTMALGAVESVRALMDELGEAAGLSPAVLAPVLKTVGIAILTIFPPRCAGTRRRAASRPSWRPRGPPWPCAWPFRCWGRCWTL